MNQPEQGPSSLGALMIGPDGAVYVVPNGTLKTSPAAGDLPHEAPAPSPRNMAADVTDRTAAQRALRTPPRTPGDAGGCFSYSADVPLGIRNRNAAQRAVRNLPRMEGEGNICFRY